MTSVLVRACRKFPAWRGDVSRNWRRRTTDIKPYRDTVDTAVDDRASRPVMQHHIGLACVEYNELDQPLLGALRSVRRRPPV